MPKLITRPSKYTCHKASGQAVVKVGGKLRYLGPFNSPESKVRYQAVISEWAAEGENRPATAATVKQSESDTILSELLAAYIKYANDYYVKDGKHTSMVHLVRVIARLWKELFAGVLVREIRPLHLKEPQRRMVADGQSRSYVNKVTSCSKTMFRWAVENDLCPAPVWQGLLAVRGLARGRTKAREPEPVLPIADKVVDATLPCPRKPKSCGSTASKSSPPRPSSSSPPTTFTSSPTASSAAAKSSGSTPPATRFRDGMVDVVRQVWKQETGRDLDTIPPGPRQIRAGQRRILDRAGPPADRPLPPHRRSPPRLIHRADRPPGTQAQAGRILRQHESRGVSRQQKPRAKPGLTGASSKRKARHFRLVACLKSRSQHPHPSAVMSRRRKQLRLTCAADVPAIPEAARPAHRSAHLQAPRA
jgi:hypothetical protein